MSKRTLPDELRSVLLSHSLDAPDPDDTIERILAGAKVGAEPAGRRRWRPSVSLIGAAASVVLLVLGVAGVRAANHSNSNSAGGSAATSAESRDGDSSAGSAPFKGPMAAQASQADGELALTPPPPNLNCSASLPGSKLVTGASTSFQATADTVFVFEFYCLAPNGQRGGSQIEAFQQVSGKLRYLSTLIEAKKGSHLQSITAGPNSVTLTGTSGDGQPSGDLLSLTLNTKDDGLTFGTSGHLIASACQAKDLTAAVSTVEQVSAADGHVVPGHFVLQLTNHSAAPCALEGYPTLVAAGNGNAVGPTLVKTLRGPAGGLKAAVPPIIELAPGTTAGAIIETGPVHPSCAPTPRLNVTLASGTVLGPVAVTLSGCGEQVHPFVNNAQGNG